MQMKYSIYRYQNELYHYGVKGMKWGVRRYQPYTGDVKGRFIGKKQEVEENTRKKKLKKALKTGASIAGIVLASYGTYKLATSPYAMRLANKGAYLLRKKPYFDKMIQQYGPFIVKKSTGEPLTGDELEAIENRLFDKLAKRN